MVGDTGIKGKEREANRPSGPEMRSSSPSSQDRLLRGEHPARNNVDEASLPIGLRAFLKVASEQGHRLKVRLTAEQGKPEEYGPAYQPGCNAERNFNEDIKNRNTALRHTRESRDVIRRCTDDTLVESSGQIEARDRPSPAGSDSSRYSSDNEEDFVMISPDETYAFPIKPDKVDPNDPDQYRSELVAQGYNPLPPKSPVDTLHNYWSPNRQKTEQLITLRAIEQTADAYRKKLDEKLEKDFGLAKKLAKYFFEDDMDGIEADMKRYKDEGKMEEYKYKEGELATLEKKIGDFKLDIMKMLSANTEHSHEHFLQELEALAKRNQKGPKWLKVSSLVRVGGF